MIGKAELIEGLYVLDAVSGVIDFGSFPLAIVANVSKITWHKRLGHFSFKRLDSVKSQPQFNNNGHDLCSVCPLAKQRRLSFISHNHLSKGVFDLIHCDTWGPFHVPTYAGHKYFLTLVDDCMRYTWIFLMRHKS